MTIETQQPHALDALPPGYRLVKRLNLEDKRALILLNLVGIIPALLGLGVFVLIALWLYTLPIQPPIDMTLTEETTPQLVVIALIAVLLVLSIHELCHGLAFQAMGARPRYGINWRKGVAYASAENYYLYRDAYLVVALAPLVVISILTVLLMVPTGGGIRFIIALVGGANVGGAVGDLWFTRECLRYPRSLLVRDYGDGAELYAREN